MAGSPAVSVLMCQDPFVLGATRGFSSMGDTGAAFLENRLKGKDDMAGADEYSPQVQLYSPGLMVRHPGENGWGVGQVQSAIGNRVTVNFQHVGKQLIDTALMCEFGS